MVRRSDIALALALAVLGVAGLVSEPLVPETGVTREWDALGVALALGMTLPVALRRRWPVVVAAVTLLATLATTSLGYGAGLAQLGLLVAIASAAYFTSRAVTVRLGAVIAGLVVVTLLSAVPAEASVSLGAVVGGVASVVLALLSGDLLREARQAERQAALSDERARIAREVHDVVGHALAGITLQARAALRRVERDPARAAAALEQIDALASSALAETRQVIGIIRSDEERAAFAPQPTLEQLDDLVATVQAPDVQIELQLDPVDGDVPSTVQVTAYRIVQESLSNVVKHARPATAVVSVRRDADELTVEVRDDGTHSAGTRTSGHGLKGMRERVLQCGGTLDAGPHADGGWAVRARLPIPGTPARTP
jgi:signal transduction histidine kinase